jgi:ankyrin repeat protein
MIQTMKTESAFAGINAETQRTPSFARRFPSTQRRQDAKAQSGKTVCLASLLLCVFALMPLGLRAATNDLTAALQKGLFEEEANRNLDAAVSNYQALAAQFDKDRQVAATAIFRLGECYRKLGRTNDAVIQYERIVREFADQQTLATLSRQDLTGMGVGTQPRFQERLQNVIAKNPEEQVRDLLQEKKTIDAIRTATSIDEEDQEIRRIQAMIQNSPDLVNAPQGQSGTPLCLAAEKGQLRVAQFLLEHGADVQRGYPLAQAAGGGHKAMVELLLQHGAAVNAAEGDSQTALHRAAARGYLSVTETLLAAKADVNAQAENGRTPLMLAVEKGVVPVAAALLAHGADPNIICRPRQGWTDRTTTGAPLHFAVTRGDEAMVALLLTNRADLTLRNPLGESALDIAAILGKPGIVRQLIAAGANVNAVSSAQGDGTPLHLATLGGYREIVALLLEHGANPNVTANLSRSGVTPLMSAAALGNSEIASLLLKHKADPNLTDSSGNTALLNAVQKQSPATVRALLAGGANPDTQTANGYPALVIAVTDTGSKEVLAALIEAKANVNAPDPEGKTALHWAAERNRKDLIELLVKAGADVNLRTKNGATPLDYARSSNQSAGRSPGLGQPPLLAYQWNFSGGQTATSIATNATSTADLLRQNGALDELPDFTRIRITRQGLSQPLEVFRTGAKLTNHFTLLETVMRFFSIRMVGNQEAWRALPFPDFGRVIIRRPSQKPGGKEQEIKVSLLNRSNVVDCAQDVPVEFGDVIEIPESIHALNAGMPNPVREMEEAFSLYPTGFAEREQQGGAERLARVNAYRTSTPCLQKSVQLVVAGETTTFKVNSWKEGFLSWALAKTEARSVLRSSSDLSRVKVTRKTGKSAKPAVFTVDVSDSPQRNDDLWLQDGDVIEVPEK